MQNSDKDEKITSVAQYVQKIAEINRINEGIDYIYNRVPMYYRGQSNYEWELQPGLFRNKKYQSLEQVIEEFEQNYPEELYDESGKEIDRFDKITKMQHYGFPTNFLDFTENPLVALFFACADKSNIDEKNGAVFVCNSFLFNVENKIETSEKINDLNKLFLENSPKNDSPHVYNSKKLEYYFRGSDPYKDNVWKIYRPHFFYGTKTMERPKKQKSIFLVFYAGEYSEKQKQIKIKFIEKKHTLYFEDVQFKIKNVNIPIRNNSTVLKIERKAKKSILEELDMMKINKVELFPEMEYYSSYLKGDLWL